MTLKTVNVTVRAQDAGGNVLPGATITAKLSGPDVDPTYGHVLPKEVTAKADETGAAILHLWPNELGSCQTFYYVTIAGAGKTVKVEATIPDANCNLWTVANLPPYDGKSDGQLAIDAAVEAVAPAQAAALDAATSATAAAGSATAAAGSASAAAGSATTASTKAADANTSAVGASQSATNAASSATAAAGSASAASGSATAAATSASTASTKAGEAAQSATTASGHKDAAAGSASTATTKAAEAASSATAAIAKATEAATSASAAAGSASTAATKASEANTSASGAATSASNASGAASIAVAAASNAAGSATAAAGSASAALTNKGLAETAKAGADTAKAGADTAKAAAETAAGTATTQAGIATTKAGEAAISATDAATSAAASQASANSIVSSQLTSAADAARASVSAGQAAASAVTAAAAAAGAAAIVTGVATGRPSIRPSLVLAFDRNGRFDPRVVVTRTGTVPGTDLNGKIATFLANVPRITYDPSTALCMGYLIEPSATNLLLRSEELDNGTWTKTRSSISGTKVVGPDGLVSGQKIVEDTSASLSHAASQAVTLSVGATHTFSAFVKAGERSCAVLRINTASDNIFAAFNLATGQVGATAVSGTSSVVGTSITPAGNGWYRISVTGIHSKTTGTALVLIHTAISATDPGGTSIVYTGDGVSGVYAFGAMLEAVASNSTYPSSYIATTSATVTRGAESNLFNPLFPGFTTSQGTAYIRGITRGTGSGNQNLAKFSDGTANNVIEVFRNSARQICLRVTVAGAVQGYVTGVAIDDHAAFELAASWTTSGFRLTINNKAPMTLATSGNLVPTVNRLSLGENCYLKNFSFFPRQLNLAEEIVLTANTTGFGTAPGAGLLESVAVPAVGAWSATRRLTAGYTGNLVDVVRSSDGASASIGVKSDGTLDEFALMNHLGAENLLLWSEQFDNVWWSKTRAAIAANAALAPDGTFTADKLTEDASAANTHYLRTDLTLAAGSDYTFSIYAKAGERTRLQVCGNMFNSGNLFNVRPTVRVDLTNGTVIAQTGVSANVIPAGNGWYRISVCGTMGAAGGAQAIGAFLEDGTGSTYTGDGSSGLYVWGAQLHQGTQLLDYCRTTSAATVSGQNLLTYPEMLDNAVWSNKFAATVLPNVAVAPDGTLSADKLCEDGSTNEHFVEQPYTFTAGVPVTLSWFLKAAERSLGLVRVTSGAIFGGPTYGEFNLATGVATMAAGTGTVAIASVGNGWYRCSISVVPTASGSGTVRLETEATAGTTSYTGTAGSGIYAWGCQLNIGKTALPYKPSTLTFTGRTSTKNVFDSTGTLASVASGVQAVEYDSVACYPNLFNAPEALDNAVWTYTSSTISANAAVAPNGQQTADKLCETATTSAFQAYESPALAASTTYNFSAYLKAAERTIGSLRIGGGINKNAWFNLATGAIGTVDAGITATMDSVGNGWYRCSITYTTVGALNYPNVIETASVNGTRTYAGAAGSGIYVWGAQLVQGAVPTIYDNQSLVQQNLLLQSQVLSNASWTKNAATITDDATTAPDGTTTADLLQNNSTDVTHYLTQAFTGQDSTPYTFSTHLKAATASYGFVRLRNKAGSFFNVMVNLSTGALVGTVTAGATCSVTAAANGFWRIAITADSGTGGSAPSAWIYSSMDGVEQGTTEDTGIYVWGSQINAGNSALPYRATTTTAYTQFIQKGPVYEAAATNVVPNNTLTGINVGTNTPATGWTMASSVDGLTRTIVGSGTVNGMAYQDVRWNGTAGVTGTVALAYAINNTVAAASNGQTWCASWILGLVGGSLANVSTLTLNLRFNDSGSAILTQQGTSLLGLTANAQRLFSTLTATDAATAFVSTNLTANFVDNAAVDFTLRIILPQLEQNSVPSSIILTSTAAVTRAADSVTATAYEAGSGYVSKVYDQSGHGRDLVQATAANRPRLALAGKIDRMTVAENLYLNSAAPVTQTVTLAVGTYTLGIVGTGSITAAAGTAVGTGFGAATSGTPKTFTVTTAGTVTLTKAGTVTQAQLNTGSALRAYVATGATAIVLGDPHANNKPQFVTDGAQQRMRASVTVPQPFTRIGVAQPLDTSRNQTLYDNGTTGQVTLYVNSTGPRLATFMTGGTGGNLNTLAANDALVTVEQYNGSNSSVAVNGSVTSQVQGNAGLDGLSLASAPNNGSLANAGFGEVILLANTVSTSDRQAIEANQKSFYSIA